MFMGYSTQHAEDVYRFLHLKAIYVIYSRDVQWLGKMWTEFYNIPNNHSADAYVDPFDDYIEEAGTDQEMKAMFKKWNQHLYKQNRKIWKKRFPLQQGQEAITQNLMQAEQEVNRI